MKQRAFIMLALLAGVLAGCDVAKDVFVPALPEAYWNYFPYEVGDSIVFTNGIEEMSFEIQNKFVDKEDRTICGVVGPITGRLKYAEINFETKLNSSLLSMTGRILIDKKHTITKYEVTIVEYNQTIENLKWTCCFCCEEPYSDVPKDIILLDNPKVQCNADGNVNEESKIYIESVVIEKGTGITAFYDNKNKKIGC